MAEVSINQQCLDESRSDKAVPPFQDVQVDSSDQASATELNLPPVDRGKQAWLFLAACWVVEALTFGFGFSFGVFQNFYSTHEPFAGSSGIAAIGTTTTGLLYMGTPFVLVLCRLFPRWARWSTLVGLFVGCLSFIIMSFCDSVSQLIGAQGVLFGISGCVAYCPSTLYIDQWFDQRKGLAYGIVWSAGGVGGVVIPLLLEYLLGALGFQTAMRVWAGIFISSIFVAFFIRPRLPYPDGSRSRKAFNMRFIMSRRFILHQVVNFIQATGYYLPAIYLPTYASTVFGTSPFLSTLTIMISNITTTIGLVVMGFLSDKLHVTTCMLISAIGASVSVFVIWGLTTTLPLLYVFCVFYGAFGGSWPSVWPGIMREVAQMGEIEGYGDTDPVMVQGVLCIGRGLGNIISGPISSPLVGGMLWKGQVMGGYGSGYGVLIVYTGLTAFLSGTHLFWEKLSLR